MALGHVKHAPKWDLSRMPPALRGDVDNPEGVPLGGFGSGYERVGGEAPGLLCSVPRRETIGLTDYFRLHPRKPS